MHFLSNSVADYPEFEWFVVQLTSKSEFYTLFLNFINFFGKWLFEVFLSVKLPKGLKMISR